MEVKELEIGRHITNTREFSGIPEGTEGEIVESPRSWPNTELVAIHWNRYEGDQLIDWFSFKDLQYLTLT